MLLTYISWNTEAERERIPTQVQMLWGAARLTSIKGCARSSIVGGESFTCTEEDPTVAMKQAPVWEVEAVSETSFSFFG